MKHHKIIIDKLTNPTLFCTSLLLTSLLINNNKPNLVTIVIITWLVASVYSLFKKDLYVAIVDTSNDSLSLNLTNNFSKKVEFIALKRSQLLTVNIEGKAKRLSHFQQVKIKYRDEDGFIKTHFIKALKGSKSTELLDSLNLNS
ncbi:hypothetical protein [Roseivirga pacifica]